MKSPSVAAALCLIAVAAQAQLERHVAIEDAWMERFDLSALTVVIGTVQGDALLVFTEVGGNTGAVRDCVVRNISESGAHIEFSSGIALPKEQLSLKIARKGRSFLARGGLVARQLRGGRLPRRNSQRTAGLRPRGAAAQE